MSHSSGLSSEQALIDYFAALLDEAPEELELAQKIEKQPDTEISKPAEVVPQLQPKLEKKVVIQQQHEDVITPKLEDIQKLLDRLETNDPVEALENIDALIEQNTLKLTESVQVDIAETVDEIQEWEVSTTEETAAEIDTPPDVMVTLQESVSLVDETSTVATVTDQPSVSTGGGGLGQFGSWESTQRNEAFQVLFFDVYGVMFAVPLDELGGIHKLEETSHLIGRPSWYLGLQTSKNSQLDVVDTAKWVMSNKLVDDSYKESYQYIVMLGESFWGLACGELKGTELIQPEAVRWRELAGKRPWLAGMVKEKMCALIHVEALIQMLHAGLDVNALDK